MNTPQADSPECLYLIAHKVRGEPAFDIATQLDCPLCMDAGGCNYGCAECDQLGFWWIIPTSGHRAYPWWHTKLDDCLAECAGEYESIIYGVPPMPASAPDHYTVAATPHSPRPAFLQSLLAKPRVAIPRRGL